MEQTPGQRLEQARLRAGYKTAQAAVERFGWTYTTYKSHENGQTAVPPEEAKVYAKAFGVTPEWIVFNVGGIDRAGIDNLILSKPPESRAAFINAFRAFLGEPVLEAKPEARKSRIVKRKISK